MLFESTVLTLNLIELPRTLNSIIKIKGITKFKFLRSIDFLKQRRIHAYDLTHCKGHLITVDLQDAE
jgi:hypothetical protein